MDCTNLLNVLMFYFLEITLTSLAICAVTVCWLVYCSFTKHYNYWKERGVPYKRPVFPFGSTRELILAETFIGKAYDNLYKEFSSERFFGIIDVKHPKFVLRDPELIKSILVNNFDHFSVRSTLGENSKQYILKHVINLNGPKWKAMRELMAPIFSTSKIKMMFPFMEKCGKQLEKYLLYTVTESSVVEITDIFSRFTVDNIATCAFGVEIDSINNRKCEFFNTVGPMLRTSKARFIRRFLLTFFPSLGKVFPVNIIPQEVKYILTNAVEKAVEYRNKNNIERHDFLDGLIDKPYRGNEKGLTIEQMSAQAFVFFIAGYSTHTSVLSFCLYELSKHSAVQNRLYQDIMLAIINNDGEINHKALQEMKYLDQVVYETLRLYGSGQILIRSCTKPFKIPKSSITLEPGIQVVIPTYSLHHDPNYFPNPYLFDPDRFSPEEVKERNPNVYLPFGAGPRNCIAKKFGMLQIKIGIAIVVANFLVTSSLIQQQPVEIDKRSIVVTPEGPVYLTLTPRNSHLTKCNNTFT